MSFSALPISNAFVETKNLMEHSQALRQRLLGVILNLAMVFGVAVVFPNGSFENINWLAAIITIVSFVALYRLKIDVLWVVLAGGIVGLAATFIKG